MVNGASIGIEDCLACVHTGHQRLLSTDLASLLRSHLSAVNPPLCAISVSIPSADGLTSLRDCLILACFFPELRWNFSSLNECASVGERSFNRRSIDDGGWTRELFFRLDWVSR